MNLKTYQEEVKRTLPDLGSQELNIAHMIFGMNSEYVEVVTATDNINRAEEYTDIMWYFCNYCNFKNINLSEIVELINLNLDIYYSVSVVEFYNEQLQCSISELTDLEKKKLAYGKEIKREDLLKAIKKIFFGLMNCYEMNKINPYDSMQKNIDKLKARYPEKFTTEKALNRDLKTEREILEGKKATKLTTDRNDPDLIEGQKNETGQHSIYLVLSEEERAKGFVRPVRKTYIHVGKKVDEKGTVLPLEEGLINSSEWAKGFYTEANGYAAYLKYPESEKAIVGKMLTKEEFEAIQNKKEYIGGCGTATTMSLALSETYARDPKFYGRTFCCGCNKHLPVEEFKWDGTDETVGS
jgi:hypothetical protein